MKKMLTLLIGLTLFSTQLNSAEFSGGIKVGQGNLEADSKSVRTSNSRTTSSSKDADSPFGALFLEATINSNLPFGLAAGIEYIPFKATIDIDSNSGDFSGEVKDHTTLYLQASKEIQSGMKVLGKVGYSFADIGSVKSSTETLTSQDSSLEGITLGLGVEKDISSYIDYVRAGIDYTEYDTVKASSSEKNYTADAEATVFYISVGKRF